MDFTLSKQHEMARTLFKEFSEKEVKPLAQEVMILRGEGFGITLHYTAVFPIVWNGKTYGDLSIPVTVSSYYKIK